MLYTKNDNQPDNNHMVTLGIPSGCNRNQASHWDGFLLSKIHTLNLGRRRLILLAG